MTHEFEPTLISRPTLEQDINTELKRDRKTDRASSIELYKKIAKILDDGAEFYVDRDSPEDKIPVIYTRKEYIDRAEAERMLVHFLGLWGLKEVSFEWIWPDVICSVG